MYDYSLIRSKRKTVSLEVTEDLVVIVRAPLHMPAYEIDRFVGIHEGWIASHLERQNERLVKTRSLTESEIAGLKLRAKDYLPGRVAYYSEIMRLYPSAIKITSAKTRFGSCSGKNGICFSWRLMLYPESAIDYVVVHELAHIVHKNHGKAFYSLIASVLPDYKERRKLLKNL